ncbi:rho GTPase-activating protein 190-like isoform X4 [Oppia nitens]|uniref:rho GTPase-activating protein 190-like isoform X4 n=1 Tax=Oppia nitens TaxID=1686743 RepID=UPI0023DB51A4|nr:rho GTPase-activating protein 190-like isoform X4 [Oppia nitens]
MARKTETSHYKIINIAVVGLSGTEKEKGCLGVGKSCLCNRFIRPSEDDYNPDHISVLSQTDFSGRIINNEHWLYWGETTKTSDEGYELAFSVIEQTEFIDDACFQPFKSGKTEPYYKRCAATRLSSAEKMMYICKNQLGIEKEYEQRYLNDGRFSIDGYVCVFDVSQVQGRSIERQIELTALILNCLMKTKKPIVLATTKHDECYDFYLKEAERLVNRKEYKGSIVLVETSAHENVNVDLAFVCCAQMIDRTKGKSKNVSFIESSRNRKDALDNANDAYLSLIQTQITDYRTLWNNTYKKLSQSQDFMNYCELFGQDSAHMTFKRHIKKLKEDYLCRKMQMYLRILPEVLTELMPDLDTIGEPTEWTTIKDRIRSHPDFDQYFVDNPDQTWQEVSDFDDGSETRIPFDLLDTPEAEQVFVEHRMSLESGERQKELRHQFKQLLQETGFVTPGKSLTEVRILFMGRECYESLSERDIIEIYEEHQKDITDLSKMNFQELLLEHSSLFYHFASLGPGSVITQDDIQKITETLEDDHRYKALDRLDQDRTLMLLRHLGFIHGPIREHCPVFPNCMDVLIEKYNACKARRPSTDTRNSHWFSESNNNHINLILLGSGGLSDELCTEIKQINETFEMDTTRFTLDFRIIGGDVDLPQNAFRTVDFSPKGCFCVYSNHQTLEYVRQSLEKTLLSDLEQEDGLPFHGLPIVILFAANSNINEKDLIFLREEGQNRAKSLQCPFIDVTNFNSHSSDGRFDTQCLSQALRALIESIQRRADLMQIYQSVLPEQALNPDIRILVCMLCGDPFNIEHIMSPFLNQNLYYVTSSHSITIEIIIGETKRFVELVCTSYHGAHAYRDELLHGFLLIYSCGRKASFATMSAFTDNIPNTPLQIVAFSDTSNSNIYYSNHDLDLQLLSEGTNMADKLEAHFISSAPNQQKSSYFIPFLKEVFERKPQIEKAFEMDDSDYSIDRPIVPTVPTRQESYHIRSGSADSDGIYEHLGDKSNDNGGELISSSGFVDGQHLSPSDDSEVYASVYNQENGEHLVKPSQIKNRRSLQAGWMERDNRVYERGSEEWLDNDVYHAYHSSHHKLPPPIKPKPGKLNLKQFDNITDAIGRLTVGPRQGSAMPKVGLLNAPLAASDLLDMPVDYTKDAIYGRNSHDYYSGLQNTITDSKHRVRLNRRNKDSLEKVGSDSDSDWSSLERRERELYNRANRKPTPHKKVRKKRGIPVAPPRLPSFESTSNHFSNKSAKNVSDGPTLGANSPVDAFETSVRANTPSDGSEVSNEDNEPIDGTQQIKSRPNHSFHLRRRPKLATQSHSLSEANFGDPNSPIESNHNNISSFTIDHSPKHKNESSLSCIQGVEEEDYNPRDATMAQLGKVLKSKSATAITENIEKSALKKEKDRKKTREDEKLEKRRIKEEERLKRLNEKKKKKQKNNSTSNEPTIEDFIQSEDNAVPLFVEKCIQFIEEEGLDSEGIYRVPGNRAHVDLLFQKFEEDPNVSIRELDIPVNAVATALKDFFSKRLPPLIPTAMMDELTDLSSYNDKSSRLSSFREFLKSLPSVNFEVIKFVFKHFVKVADNCRLNSMDTKNLAICWWPTLLPIEFSDMLVFEQMRPHLEDFVQTLIDEFQFLFGNEDVLLIV